MASTDAIHHTRFAFLKYYHNVQEVKPIVEIKRLITAIDLVQSSVYLSLLDRPGLEN